MGRYTALTERVSALFPFCILLSHRFIPIRLEILLDF